MNKSTLGAPTVHFDRFPMPFGNHFGIDFFSFFSKLLKNMRSTKLTHNLKGSRHPKPCYFLSNFQTFVMFFAEPLLERIFGAPSADLHSRCRLLVPLRIPRGANMDPWSHKATSRILQLAPSTLRRNSSRNKWGFEFNCNISMILCQHTYCRNGRGS